jgi:hypothetical protein
LAKPIGNRRKNKFWAAAVRIVARTEEVSAKDAALVAVFSDDIRNGRLARYCRTVDPEDARMNIDVNRGVTRYLIF